MKNEKISIGFAIDKPQTFQTIEKLLRESIRRGHPCTVYSCFDMTSAFDENDRRSFKNIVIHDKNVLVSVVSESVNDFDAFVGINLFNKGWGKLYSIAKNNVFAVEYCWNEIYNTSISVVSQPRGFKTEARLFCNSNQTKKMIETNRSSSKNLISLGSTWFELLSSMKIGTKSKKIVFLSPHNSMYGFDKDLKVKVELMLKNLRDFCDKKGMTLWLKDRRKYRSRYTETINWDMIVYDDDPHDHIECYKDAELAISFCSSGINEFSFLEVPYLCVCPEYQERLNPQIHKVYYSGEIIDDKHCASVSSKDMTSYEELSRKIENLIASEKSWNEFQDRHFYVLPS
mgnify:CR=1 FL=1